MTKPIVVCLCGSTKFRSAFEAANKAETLAGRIVLSVGFFAHSGDGEPTEEQKKNLDELHLRKIDLADEVLFLNVEGYVGSSTKRELAYSVFQNKKFRFLHQELGETFMEINAHEIGKLISEFMLPSVPKRPTLG
jgi:hypothetical protein